MRRIRVAKTILPRHYHPMEHLSPNSPYHYDVVARAIAFIDARHGDQPGLGEVARATGLSPAHFQRVFSQWAGVSPKRYQQYLTLDHAKAMLRDRATVLDTAHGTGLSGSSRLHDLFLRWEAMSPGQYLAKGAGLTIFYGWFNSPFGETLVMGTSRGICGMAFSAETGRDAALVDMTARWPAATFEHRAEPLHDWVQAALAGTGETSLFLIGAPFQIKVWEALLQVPSGFVTTYSDIATHIDTPKAVRAVGTAVGRNPIAWLIPCHRALRKTGGLGGYHWGLPVKRAMLARESARYEAAL